MFINNIDCKYFTDEFLIRHKEILNYNSWNFILNNIKINENILRIISKYFKNGTNDIFGNLIYSCWKTVTYTQNLSIQFIKDFKDKINWYFASKYLNLNEQLISEFKDKVNWYFIFKYQKIRFSKRFILDYINNFYDYNMQNIIPAPNYIHDYGESEEDQKETKIVKKILNILF